MVAKSRRAIIANQLRVLHLDYVHHLRVLEHELENVDDNVPLKTGNSLCSASARLMRGLYGLRQNEIHCCIKMNCPVPAAPSGHGVITWAKSSPIDSRDAAIIGVDAKHQPPEKMSDHSAWSAIHGLNDGSNDWQKYSCFGCDDLEAARNKFVCPRQD